MSPEEHDRAVAATSHLPHLVAAAIAGSTPEEYVSLTGSGWQDTTRIAAGDPALWRQIMLANRANLSACAGATVRAAIGMAAGAGGRRQRGARPTVERGQAHPRRCGKLENCSTDANLDRGTTGKSN